MLWGEKTAKIKGLAEKGKLGAKSVKQTEKRMPEAVGVTGEGMDGLRTARSGDACSTQDDSKQQPL